MEVCEELAFHGIECILSVSVADGQVLHVDVEKVRAPCASRNARLSAQRSALHDAGAPAPPVSALTSWRDAQKEDARNTQKDNVHAAMRRRRTRTPSFVIMRRRRTRTPSSSTKCTTSSRSHTLTSHQY